MNRNLYTVEQVELIRRVRNSGLTKEQVVDAWNRMDRMDAQDEAERAAKRMKCHSSPSNQLDVRLTNLLNGEKSVTPVVQFRDVSITPAANCHNSLPPVSRSLMPSSSSSGHHHKPVSITPVHNNHWSLEGSQSSKDSSTPVDHMGISSSGPLSHVMSSCDNSLGGLEARFKEYKQRPEYEVADEIRNFVVRHNIRQTMVAEMAKISQGYVSKFFRGEGNEMSEKSKNQIIFWYLKFRDNPTEVFNYCFKDRSGDSHHPDSAPRVTPAASPALLFNPVVASNAISLTPALPTGYLPDAGMFPLRRDRFIFRPQHLEILEKYFAKNEYPNQYEKETIANECNDVVESVLQRPLIEKDRVTLTNVANWFNNKRKEAKLKKGDNHYVSTGGRRGRPPSYSSQNNYHITSTPSASYSSSHVDSDSRSQSPSSLPIIPEVCYSNDGTDFPNSSSNNNGTPSKRTFISTPASSESMGCGPAGDDHPSYHHQRSSSASIYSQFDVNPYMPQIKIEKDDNDDVHQQEMQEFEDEEEDQDEPDDDGAECDEVDQYEDRNYDQEDAIPDDNNHSDNFIDGHALSNEWSITGTESITSDNHELISYHANHPDKHYSRKSSSHDPPNVSSTSTHLSPTTN